MRYLSALGISISITFGLLFLMQYLIQTGRTALTEDRAFKVVDFVRVKREESLQQKKSKPKKPPIPEAPPPSMVQTQESQTLAESSETISFEQIDVSVSQDIQISANFALGLAASDGDYLPIVKVAPIYPSRALERGLEGFVIVEFTVTKSGKVLDPIVIDSTSTIFNKAALRAAAKFKYKPRVVDGEAIAVAGVRNKITFKLED